MHNHFSKLFLSFLLFFFASHFSFSQNKNLVLRNTFSSTSIRNLKTNLNFENLTFDQTYSDEIIIEIYTNNNKLIPQITITNENTPNSTLNITSAKLKNRKGDICSVVLYLPYKYSLQNVNIHNNYSNIDFKKLDCQELEIENISGQTLLNMVFCQSTIISQQNGNIICKNFQSEYFFIDNSNGNIVFELTSNPQAYSYIKSINGRIDFYFSDDLKLLCQAKTINGIIQDKINNKSLNHAQYFKAFNDGDVIIELQTINGDITLSY
jgi:uncharacterized lipoprotein YehR (DUF1307 family)